MTKKPPMTRTDTKSTKGRTTVKKVVRLKRTSDYESDSDLSIESAEEEDLPSAKRPSRSAAKAAAKKLSASVKDWGVVAPTDRKRKRADDDDESSFESSKEESSESENSSEEESSESEDSSDDSEEDVALVRARERQRLALANAKRGKKAVPAKGKKPLTGKGKKKKFESESESESDVDSDEDAGDPLAEVDMDALVEEALAGARFSILHGFCWFRVVLDEAHVSTFYASICTYYCAERNQYRSYPLLTCLGPQFIKSRSSQTAAAAFSLTSIHRWCLSGTPLQNRVGELYSLIRFLRIDPMAHYFCRQKGCDCKSIHYRFQEGKCVGCGHRPFTHHSHFNKHVLNPIQREGYTGDGRRAMFKLKNEVLDKCLLRRTKETRAEDMNLPPRIVSIRPVRLHPVEEDFYNALYTQSRSSFEDYVASGTVLNNYAHIFDLLTKMRQAVNHPYLILFSKKAAEKRLLKGPPVANGSVDCDLCHEPPTERVVSACCGAGFCRECVVEYLSGATGDSTPCPSCDAPFSIDLNQATTVVVDDGVLSGPSPSRGSTVGPSLKSLSHVSSGSILRRIDLQAFATSSKIEALIQELTEMRKKRPGAKALVFSQFTNMLDLCRFRLTDPLLSDLGLNHRIIHGSMDIGARDAALKDFREDNDCRVLLMSLKAAGVALNLTVASECYIMDLWWNPAAEFQAIDRTHRLGQHRPIRAVRFVAEGTVEERVLQLQEKKRLVFDGTIGRDAGSLTKLTASDMAALFG